MEVHDGLLDCRQFDFSFAAGTELCHLVTAEPWGVHFVIIFSFSRNNFYWLNITQINSFSVQTSTTDSQPSNLGKHLF